MRKSDQVTLNAYLRLEHSTIFMGPKHEKRFKFHVNSILNIFRDIEGGRRSKIITETNKIIVEKSESRAILLVILENVAGYV